MKPAEDPVLQKLRAALQEAYGGRLRQVLLFGSRARGDQRPDSDYDIAVFLDGIDDWYGESTNLINISFAALGDIDASSISALPFEADALERRTPLMHEIRREGVPF